MILIALGSEVYGFNRLLELLDELCDEKILDGEEIVAQIGKSKYESRNYKTFSLIAHEEYRELENNSDFIISHAGTGSIIPALKNGKKVIVFPRLSEYGEHIDDHQLELSSFLSEKNYALCAENKEELIAAIERIKTFVPEPFPAGQGHVEEIILSFLKGEQPSFKS